MIQKVFAGVVVDDLDAAGAWYASVLGRPADAAPMDGLLEWHLQEAGRLQVVELQKIREVQNLADWGAGGASSVAFVVRSLDEQLRVLESNRIPLLSKYLDGPEFKTASVKDAAGNIVTFVEELAG